jgi:hypothetical protein
MIYHNELDDRIVIFGMSCAGKTTFAKQLVNHHYYCFDAMFPWHIIETFGMSIESSLRHINESCVAHKFVLDGWHLSDSQGLLLPDDSCVYVIYAPYQQIISQYRVAVYDPEEHRPMFKKWYQDIDYSKFPKVRYFKNQGSFIETDVTEFLLARSQ